MQLSRILTILFISLFLIGCGGKTSSPSTSKKNKVDLIVNTAIKNGTVNKRLPKGLRALHLIAFGGEIQHAKRLLDNGATINVQSDDGTTAIALATQKNKGSMVEFLLQSGADPNLAEINGITPLMRAAFNGQTYIGELLIKNGACIDAKTKDGVTAEQLVKMKGHDDFLDMLKTSKQQPIATQVKTRSKYIHLSRLLQKATQTPELIKDENEDNQIEEDILKTIIEIDGIPSTLSSDEINQLADDKDRMQELIMATKPKVIFLEAFYKLCKKLEIAGSKMVTDSVGDLGGMLSILTSAQNGELTDAQLDALDNKINSGKKSLKVNSAIVERLKGVGEIPLVILASATRIEYYENEESRLKIWQLLNADFDNNPDVLGQKRYVNLLSKNYDIEEDDDVLEYAGPVLKKIKAAAAK